MEGYWESPPDGGGSVGDVGEAAGDWLVTCVVDRLEGNKQFEPVGYYDSEDIEGEFDGYELASTGVLGGFCCPHRDDCLGVRQRYIVDGE